MSRIVMLLGAILMVVAAYRLVAHGDYWLGATWQVLTWNKPGLPPKLAELQTTSIDASIYAAGMILVAMGGTLVVRRHCAGGAGRLFFLLGGLAGTCAGVAIVIGGVTARQGFIELAGQPTIPTDQRFTDRADGPTEFGYKTLLVAAVAIGLASLAGFHADPPLPGKAIAAAIALIAAALFAAAFAAVFWFIRLHYAAQLEVLLTGARGFKPADLASLLLPMLSGVGIAGLCVLVHGLLLLCAGVLFPRIERYPPLSATRR